MLAKFKLEKREPIRATFSINKVISAEKVEKALAEEIERATSVEDQLREDLIAETERATASEEQLREDLIAETERATASEESLQENINSEKARAESVEADLSANLLAEKERAESVEADISGTLAAEVNRLDLEDGRLNNQIQVAFETIEENKEKTETAINGLAQDIETLDSKVDQNIASINDNVDVLTGEVENIAGELDGKQPLGNYALKSDITGFATLQDVEHAVSQIQQFKHQVIDELPLFGSPSIMYLVPKIDTPNVYEEYIWLEDEKRYEDIGSTAVDLSDYAKKTDIPTDYATTTQLVTLSTQTARYDFSNIASGIDYVISETIYGGGESGKRKWRNGRFEQWGVATTNATGETEFTIHEAFKDMLFSVFIEPREKGNFFHYAIPSATRKFKTRVAGIDGTVLAIKIQWRAYGFWK